MKYELSHDTIARQVYEKSSVEAKARRKIKLLVERAHERHQQNAKILLSKEDLEEIKPFESAIAFSEAEHHFIQRSKWAIHRQRNLLIGLTALVLVTLAALSIWALREKSRAEKARQKIEVEKTRATSVLLASKAREAQHINDGTQALRFAHYSALTDLNLESRDILFEQFYQPERYYYHQQIPHQYPEQSLRQVAITDKLPSTYFFLYANGELFSSNENLIDYRPMLPAFKDIRHIAMVPHQPMLLVNHADSLIFFNYETQEIGQRMKSPTSISQMQIADNGQQLLTIANKNDRAVSNMVLVWELEQASMRIVDTLFHASPVLNITTSPNGQYFATETSGSFHLWSKEGKLLDRVSKNISLETGMFFYPKENMEGCLYLIKPPSPFKANSLRIYEWCGAQLVDRTNQLDWSLPDDNLGTLALSPNGMMAISGSQSPIYCFKPYFDQNDDLQIGLPYAQLYRRQTVFDEHLVFHPNEGQLISTGKQVSVWAISSEFRPYRAFSPEYQQGQVQHGLCESYPHWWTYTTDEKKEPTGVFRMFKSDEVEPFFTHPFRGKTAPLVSMSSTNAMAFFAESTNELMLFDSSGHLIFQKDFQAVLPDFVALNTSGQRLLVGSQKSDQLTIFNQKGTPVWERTFPFQLNKALFSPTDPNICLITGSDERASFLLRLNLKTNAVDSVPTKSYLDRHLAISQDGKRIVLVGSNRIEVLDSALQVRFTLQSEDATFNMARLSPNGKCLVVIDSQEAQVFDIKHSQEPLVNLKGVDDAVLSQEDNQLLVLAPLNSEIHPGVKHQLQVWPFGVKAVLEAIEQMQIADLPEDTKTLYSLK